MASCFFQSWQKINDVSYLISFVLRFTIINIKVVHLLQCFSLERQYPLILNLVSMFPPTQYSNIAVSILNYFYTGWIRTGDVTPQLLSSQNSCFSLLLENSYYHFSKTLLFHLLHFFLLGIPSNACWSPSTLLYISWSLFDTSYQFISMTFFLQCFCSVWNQRGIH